MSQSRFLFLDQDQYKMVSKEIPDSSSDVSKPMSFFIVSLECSPDVLYEVYSFVTKNKESQSNCLYSVLTSKNERFIVPL